MRKYLYYDALREELYDKEKKDIRFIAKRTFKDYVDENDIEYSIAGKTKLKEYQPHKDDRNNAKALLSFTDSKDEELLYEIKDYKLCKVKGYIPVEEEKFIEVVGINPLFLLLLLLLLLLIGFGIYMLLTSNKQVPENPQINRYIEDAETETLNADSSSTRYRFNTTMTVIKDTIQNMNFENVNEEKYLQIKIKLHPDDEDYIFDSGLIPPGKMLTGDALLTHIEPEEYETIAECYSYGKISEEDFEQLSQTNFEIKLVVQ